MPDKKYLLSEDEIHNAVNDLNENATYMNGLKAVALAQHIATVKAILKTIRGIRPEEQITPVGIALILEEKYLKEGTDNIIHTSDFGVIMPPADPDYKQPPCSLGTTD